MRILLVTDHYPPAGGGLAVQAQRHAERLSARGHELAVLAAGVHDAGERAGGVEVVTAGLSFARIPRVYQEGSPAFHPPWPDPAFRRALARLVARLRPDVVHVHGWSVLSAVSLPSPPPIVCTLHDYGLCCPKKSLVRHGQTCAGGRGLRCLSCDSDDQPTPRRSALAAALELTVPVARRRVRRWLAVSDYVRERHLQAGLDPARVTVLPPLVDQPEAPVAPSPDAPYILYVGPGPEQRHKGRSVLLEAFARLRGDGPRLVLVGGRDRLADPGARIEDRGRLGGAALGAAFHGAAFAVVPSVWPDPCPAVAVEAMGAGRPVIASAAGGLPSIVQDGRSGLLVAPGDPEALAAAMRALIEDSGRRRAMGAAALAGFERFRTENVLPRLEAVYRDAAGD